MPEPCLTGDGRGPERRPHVRRGGARFKVVLLIAVAAIVALALETVDSEDSGDGYTVLAAPPEELVGMWVTGDRGYSDRALVIGQDHIELHLGEEGGIQSDPILSIRALQGPDSWAYEIDYESAQGVRTLAINLYPDGVLRLRNPAAIAWRRSPTR